jgi:AraC-like DNA-binding protein
VARRVLEDPARFRSLDALVPLTGLAPAALRARFRRRGLPSPLDYVRGLRLLAVAHHLAGSTTTVSASALGLGFHSSGNLARFSRSLSGRLPSDLRAPDVGAALLLEFVGSLLGPERVDGWRALDGTFVQVA